MLNKFSIIIVSLVIQSNAWAAAPPPTGSPPSATCDASANGKLGLGSVIPYFCDGTSWRAWALNTSVGGACAQGAIRYSSGQYQACHWTYQVWYAISGTATGASCPAASAGRLAVNAGVQQYCNGTNWISTY